MVGLGLRGQYWVLKTPEKGWLEMSLGRRMDEQTDICILYIQQLSPHVLRDIVHFGAVAKKADTAEPASSYNAYSRYFFSSLPGYSYFFVIFLPL